MALGQLTSSNVEKLIKESDILVIDFWAAWCAPCRMFAPTFEKAAKKHPNMTFVKCNTEEQPEVAAMFGIRSIPTLAIFREGILVFMQPGALPPDVLEDLLTKVEALDMDEVRKKVAEEEKKLEAEKKAKRSSARA